MVGEEEWDFALTAGRAQAKGLLLSACVNFGEGDQGCVRGRAAVARLRLEELYELRHTALYREAGRVERLIADGSSQSTKAMMLSLHDSVFRGIVKHRQRSSISMRYHNGGSLSRLPALKLNAVPFYLYSALLEIGSRVAVR